MLQDFKSLFDHFADTRFKYVNSRSMLMENVIIATLKTFMFSEILHIIAKKKIDLAFLITDLIYDGLKTDESISLSIWLWTIFSNGKYVY